MSTSTLASATPESRPGTPASPFLAVRNGRSRSRLMRDRGAVFGLVVIALMVICGAAAPIVAPYNPTDQDLIQRARGPSMEHPLGMDGLGRDQLSELLYG